VHDIGEGRGMHLDVEDDEAAKPQSAIRNMARD
jgi:hypothetical protein